ncbi:MAG: Rieske 2Fe-2S domain-containing protein [Chloroflexi bacterium]|nr:Rieske 2Fe-2S domain-containing protein [Chloroflexota bacterium]
MLSHADNELITRTGRGTLMGALFRRYWLPALISDELEADGAPVRFRLLNEDLVAFRDTSGEVGVLSEYCPHRGVSLALGRNEYDGLRCLYHGWKFDVNGQCVDMPTEPVESGFRNKVRAGAYAVREHGGAVWVYMGAPESEPPFPFYYWTTVPDSNRIMAKWIQDANWLQSLEGGIDTVHASFLHNSAEGPMVAPGAQSGNNLMFNDTRPKLDIEETAYGFRYASIRRGPDEAKHYVRITPHIMPASSYPPFSREDNRIWNMWVPRDDGTCWAWDVCFNETKPMSDELKEQLKEYRGYYAFDPKTFVKYAGPQNMWLQDRELMKKESWSGIRGLFVQDNAVQESMGPIVDRTIEHLGTTDAAIIKARKLYIKAAIALAEEGVEPPGVWEQGDYELIRSDAYVQPVDSPWKVERPLEERFAVGVA